MQGVDQGVQSIVLRLPIYVYNESSFVSFMVNVHVEAAKKNGFVSYIGTGDCIFFNLLDSASAESHNIHYTCMLFIVSFGEIQSQPSNEMLSG